MKERIRLNNLSKFFLYFFLVVLFLVFLLKFQYGAFVNNPTDPDSIRIIRDELKCLDRVIGGALYEQDVTCHQGPFFYITLYNLREIFVENFYLSVIVLALLIYALMFLFLYKIIEKEVGGGYFLGLVLYVALVFVYGLRDFDFSILLAFFWFFLGFYLLFYTGIRFKEIFAGAIFALAFLTKPTYIMPIGISLVFYCVRILIRRDKDGKIGVAFRKIYKSVPLIIPIIVILFLFHLWFPNLLIYTFSLANPDFQSEEINLTKTLFSEGFFTTFSKLYYILTLQHDLVKIFFVFIVVLSLFSFLKRRGFIEGYTLSLFLIASLGSFVSGNNIIEYKRIIFVMPFFIVVILGLIKIYSKEKGIKKYLLFSIVLILLYPAFKIVYATHQVTGLEREMGYVLHFMPKQDYILTDKDRLRFYDYELDYTPHIVTRNLFGKADPSLVPAFEKAGLVNMSLWEFEESKKETLLFSILMEKISKKEYDSIMFVPNGEGLTLQKLLIYIEKASLKDDRKDNIFLNKIFPMKCKIYIPTLEERCFACDHRLETYFLNESHCEDMRRAMFAYYRGHFDKICKKDGGTARTISSVLKINNMDIMKDCRSDKNLLRIYTGRYDIETRDFLFIFNGLLILFVFIYLMKEEYSS